MNPRLGRLAIRFAALGAALALAACGGHSSSQFTPQMSQQQPSALQKERAQQTAGPQPKPMFLVLRYKGAASTLPVSSAMPLWHGSFAYSGAKYDFVMVGANPAKSDRTTTIPVDIIPVKIEVGTKTISTFNPEQRLPDGRTVIQNIKDSPLFQKGVDFVQGGTDLGATQYIDAFQRGNFWRSVGTNTGYHVLLSPKVLAGQTIKTPTSADGKTATEFGTRVGLVDINYFDTQAQSLIKTLGIGPGTLPLFVTYDVYLTNGTAGTGTCCIGGYHSFTGVDSYAQASYIGTAGAFSQDVSAMSHELGEWMDDPLTTNNSPCGVLEVGDPLENEANYGAYPYTFNGFTYNLQDLVFLPYFGAPSKISVNAWKTFQGQSLSVCQNGA